MVEVDGRHLDAESGRLGPARSGDTGPYHTPPVRAPHRWNDQAAHAGTASTTPQHTAANRSRVGAEAQMTRQSSQPLGAICLGSSTPQKKHGIRPIAGLASAGGGKGRMSAP